MSKPDFPASDGISVAEIRSRIQANPKLLDLLSDPEAADAAMTIMADENLRYGRRPWEWVTEQVYTIDEASQERVRWPDKAYLKDLFAVLQAEQMIAIPKSRRMMVTWAVAAYAVHQARFFPGHAVFIQSETESKSAYVVDQRCRYIEENIQPEPYRRTFRSVRTQQGLVGVMTYEQTGSYIKAVAQGGDVLRSYTPSILILDEADFQPEAHAAVVAAIPFAEKNAKIILVSSSNGPIGPIAELAKSIGFVRFEG